MMENQQSESLIQFTPQSLQTLAGLLNTLKTRPPGKDHWNLSQVAHAKQTVIARYAPVFSLPNVAELDQKEFLGFLTFENNLHWTGLERHGDDVTKDMSRLRLALTLLVDETIPIKERLDRIRPKTGRAMVKYLGRAILTAVLQVVYPERYGVLNNVLEKAMKQLGIWPEGLNDASEAEVYEAANARLLGLASELGIDLWTLDYLWWEMGSSFPAAKAESSTRGTDATEQSPKSDEETHEKVDPPPTRGPQQACLDPHSILGPGGVIAQQLAGYEVRDEQLRMTGAVAEAIASGSHLMVEAGTGVGKSFAYLVPAILAAAELGRRESSSRRTRSISRIS
jgi:hypothetical protein